MTTQTDVIAVLSPDNGDGTATVVTMTYDVTPKPGEVIASHGDNVTTVKRDAPAGDGMQWAAPYAVNCGRHGLVTCTRDAELADIAARGHIMAHRSKSRVFASHDDAQGRVMCDYHFPLVMGRPGTAAHAELCVSCPPISLPDTAVCEQCARCGLWSNSLSVWLV